MATAARSDAPRAIIVRLSFIDVSVLGLIARYPFAGLLNTSLVEIPEKTRKSEWLAVRTPVIRRQAAVHAGTGTPSRQEAGEVGLCCLAYRVSAVQAPSFSVDRTAASINAIVSTPSSIPGMPSRYDWHGNPRRMAIR